MYRFKGFLTIDGFADLSPNVVAPIGELSAYSLTFARDIKPHIPDNKIFTVNEFSSKSSENGELDVPNEIITKAFELISWIYTRQTNLVIAETTAEFRNAFITQFSSSCSNIDCGTLIAARNGKFYPQYITWKTTGYATEDNQSTIWFNDASFQQMYDEYEIVVIPPVTNLETFFGSYNTAVEIIGSRTFADTMNVIQAARQGQPETIVTAEEYEFYNKNNTSVKTKTNWSFLIYGPAGNDSDLIRYALLNYITANSLRTEAEWKAIFPDIFKNTEFMIFPRWENFAIAEMSLQTGIYSPIMNLRKEIAYLKSFLSEYSTYHIDTHATVMAHPYKSLQMLVIGGSENRNNLYELNQVFPDIINVSSTSLDFNRMSQETKGFLERLANMIYIAETMDDRTDIPSSFRRLERNGITYVSTRYLNVRYNVATKLTTPVYPA